MIDAHPRRIRIGLEPMGTQTLDRVGVMRAHHQLRRSHPVKDLVQQLPVRRPQLKLELDLLRQPAPADKPVAVEPQPRRLVAVRKLRRPERDLPERALDLARLLTPKLLRQLEYHPEITVSKVARMHARSL